jgi:DNA-binding Xre family transcriptional regulator
MTEKPIYDSSQPVRIRQRSIFSLDLKDDYVWHRRKIATALKAARKECKWKWSQADAAALAGISQSALSRMEHSGEVEFTVLERLAYIYGCPMSNFQGAPAAAYELRTMDDYRVWLKTGKFPRR